MKEFFLPGVRKPVRVVNLKDLPGNGYHRQVPQGVIRVDRPTRWGNPFKIGDPDPAWCGQHTRLTLHGVVPAVLTRKTALEHYETWLNEELVKDPQFLAPLRQAEALACWCKPLACHADIIAKRLSTGR